ncbi:Ribonuclease D [Candidatus Trichorickettsia mobilis]|uniref:Ribonuclease D n=1 Tax=Candidatus Trichorickettsia mobilis TaxID=1346319 RepID=A0ABZ0UYB8_9RICK|nr:ribonuclease D [Candidatus Trichorickettsia mobilis]WPY01064.1 Ribonuclease D [Candidatus Trichorickettsia mobilis]
MILINTQQQLDEFCDIIINDSKIVCIDTEFERRHTYYAELSIIQIISNKHQLVVDALAGLNLTKIKNILLNDQILKIFHSPREDFEIFYHIFKKLPKNVFDTQLAARVTGLGIALSYSDLCKIICKVDIDKTYQTANWLQRPLPHQMLQYAIIDVEYLHSLYQYLQNIIDSHHLNDIYNNAIITLLKTENYTVNYTEAWKKVKFQDRSKDFIYRMQIIAAFRESCAININIPKRHFATDDDLVKICYSLPITTKELRRLQLHSLHIVREKYMNQLFDLCLGLRESKELLNFDI